MKIPVAFPAGDMNYRGRCDLCKPGVPGYDRRRIRAHVSARGRERNAWVCWHEPASFVNHCRQWYRRIGTRSLVYSPRTLAEHTWTMSVPRELRRDP